jgi:hypothetical protein
MRRWAGRLIFFLGCDEWLDHGWRSGFLSGLRSKLSGMTFYAALVKIGAWVTAFAVWAALVLGVMSVHPYICPVA